MADAERAPPRCRSAMESPTKKLDNSFHTVRNVFQNGPTVILFLFYNLFRSNFVLLS